MFDAISSVRASTTSDKVAASIVHAQRTEAHYLQTDWGPYTGYSCPLLPHTGAHPYSRLLFDRYGLLPLAPCAGGGGGGGQEGVTNQMYYRVTGGRGRRGHRARSPGAGPQVDTGGAPGG